MNQIRTQCAAILSHLQTNNRLTPRDALNKYGCFRLAARSYELREMGHAIRNQAQQ